MGRGAEFRCAQGLDHAFACPDSGLSDVFWEQTQQCSLALSLPCQPQPLLTLRPKAQSPRTPLAPPTCCGYRAPPPSNPSPQERVNSQPGFVPLDQEPSLAEAGMRALCKGPHTCHCTNEVMSSQLSWGRRREQSAWIWFLFRKSMIRSSLGRGERKSFWRERP